MLLSLDQWSSHGSIGREIRIHWERDILSEFVLFDWDLALWTCSIKDQAISIWTGMGKHQNDFLMSVLFLICLPLCYHLAYVSLWSCSLFLQQIKHYEALSKRYSSNWSITISPYHSVYTRTLWKMYNLFGLEIGSVPHGLVRHRLVRRFLRNDLVRDSERLAAVGSRKHRTWNSSMTDELMTCCKPNVSTRFGFWIGWLIPDCFMT